MSPNNKQLSSKRFLERLELMLAISIQVAILVVVVSAFVQQNWWVGVSGSLVFALTFVPALLQRRLKVRLPTELTLFACVFLYSSFVLGEVRDFYDRLWWWDVALHGSSAFVVGATGFLMVYVFYVSNRLSVAPVYIAMISCGFAISIGTIWEIFEFVMDWFFGFNMQKTGLVDTMTDLMVNTAGGLLASLIGYFYVRHRKV